MAGFIFAAAICCLATTVFESARALISQRNGADDYREHVRIAAGGGWMVLILCALALIVHALGAKYF